MAASMWRNVTAHNICKCCSSYTYSIFLGMKTRSSTLNRMKYTSSVLPREVEVDQDVMDSLKDGEKHKHHPGLLRLKTVTLPERIEKAISILIEKYPRPDIVERAQKLYNQLLCRQPLIEKMELRRRASKYESELMEKENINFQVLTDETEKDALSKSLIKTVKKHIKNSVYHWKGMKYDTSLGLIYLVARAAPNYSILLQCMTEIKKRDPEFSPQSIYNHGSGIGSSVWAANAIWDKLVVEHYCVDPSGDMNSIARLLLQDGDNQKDMHVPGVYFRQFQPSADTNKFHLVVSAYCLMEHESMQERLTMVDNLWKLTDSYMILIENGTQAGHGLVMEARDYILQMQTQEEDSFSGHVFAPCPHDVGCPKLLREVPTPCTFQVHHTPLHLQSKQKVVKAEKFSYIIMKKGKRRENDVHWPRCVQPLSKPRKHIHCRLCCPDGTYQHVVLTPRRHSKALYRCAKYCQWGDQLPMEWTNKLSDELKRHVKDSPPDES